MDFPIISSLIILPTIGAIFILFGRSSSNYIAAKNISLFTKDKSTFDTDKSCILTNFSFLLINFYHFIAYF